MNYTVQFRIREIIELLDRIIYELERGKTKFDSNNSLSIKSKKIYLKVYEFFESQLEWENIVLEKTIRLKDSILNEYQQELEELEKKQAIIKDSRLNSDDSRFQNIREYFFDEHFLLALFSHNPDFLLDVEHIIIEAENINWKPTFSKLAIQLMKSSDCNIESLDYFIKRIVSENSPITLNEQVRFLFSPELSNKDELEKNIKSNYERYIKIDALINNGSRIRQLPASEIDLELVLSSLIKSGHDYGSIPNSFQSNELVYLFASFNTSHGFKYADNDIQSNEAIVNYALNINKYKRRPFFFQEENSTTNIQHAKNIYPFTSEEIRACEYLANFVASEFGEALQFMNDTLKNNWSIVKKCINNNGNSIQYLPEQLRSNKELSLLAVKQNPKSYNHLNFELKFDPEILKYLTDSNLLDKVNIPKKIKTNGDLNKKLLIEEYLTNPDVINYCGDSQKKWFLKFQEEQEIYNNWLKIQNAQQHEQMNGINQISENESYFISKYVINNCIDVGCGTGNRTLPFFQSKQIEFKGIDNQSHLINHSPFKDHIIQKDITSPIFNLDELEPDKYDIAFYFGGVINGFISNPVRFCGWQNLQIIAQKHAKYVLVDTLSHFTWFKEETNFYGEVIQLNPAKPPQFFYSQRGLKTLFAKHHLELVEEKEEPLGPYKRTQYVLQYKS